MQDSFLIVDWVISISLLSLAAVSLLKQGYKSPLNRIFASFSFLIAIFIISSDISNDVHLSTQISVYANYVAFSSAVAVAITLMQFVAKLANIQRINLMIKRFLFPLWTICLISATPMVVANVMIQDHIYAVEYGPFIWLFVIGILWAFSLLTYAMIQGLKHSRGIKKRQLATTGIGFLITLPLVMLFSLVIPLSTGIFAYNIFATAPIAVLVVSLYYGVVRYHLFDIRMAAVRTLAYILSLSVLIVLYYALAAVISSLFLTNNFAISQSPLSISVALVMLFVFQPIKKFFDRLTNRIFYRDYYDTDEFFSRLYRLLTSTGDLRSLLGRTAEEVAVTLKSEQAFFFINTRDGHYVMAGTNHHKQLSKDEIILIQEKYGNSDEVVVGSMLGDDDPIFQIMDKHKIELILPLVQNKLIGYLFLGEHRTSQYTARDIKVLSTVSDGLVIAIQNTLSIQEIQDINEANLQQHISDATKELRTSNEMLRQIDEEKDEFISIASHELRTPMTVVRGYINMLENEQPGHINSKQKEILEKVNENTKTLITLVNDMLDLSKLESGKLEMMLSDNPVVDLVNQSLDKMRLLFVNKGIELEYTGDNAIVRTDPDKFERVMLNLLSNAYKFTASGGKVTVTTSVDESGRIVTVGVADTGIGIPEKSLKNLFKKFSQIENYLQRQSGGTGLGLAICKQLIEKLGGKIWVESQVGVGSKFYFTVPLTESKK